LPSPSADAGGKGVDKNKRFIFTSAFCDNMVTSKATDGTPLCAKFVVPVSASNRFGVFPRTDITSDLCGFEVTPGNHSMTMPTTISSGSTRRGTRGIMHKPGNSSAPKRCARFFQYTAGSHGTMPLVAVESGGGRLGCVAPGVQEIPSLPKKYDNRMISHDPADKPRHPVTYYEVVPVRESEEISPEIFCNASRDRNVATGLLAPGLLLCSSTKTASSPVVQQKLITGSEVVDFEHSKKERGSPGWVRDAHLWKWTIESEARRLFAESGARLFVFWKELKVGSGREPLLGASDVSGQLVVTVSVKSTIELQHCKTMPVLFRWTAAPHDNFCVALSTTAAHEIIQHANSLTISSRITSNQAYPLAVGGGPAQSQDASNVFWLERAHADLISGLVPDWDSSLEIVRGIIPVVESSRACTCAYIMNLHL
jgi:hypothetical protein